MTTSSYYNILNNLPNITYMHMQYIVQLLQTTFHRHQVNHKQNTISNVLCQNDNNTEQYKSRFQTNNVNVINTINIQCMMCRKCIQLAHR